MSTLTVSKTRMRAKQYLAMGDDPPGMRLELVDGEISVMSSPTPNHAYTEQMLKTIIHNHVLMHRLGELFGDVDTVIDEFNVRRPDIIYFAADRLHLVGPRAMEGPPDLCVEIVSPASEKIDRQDKFAQYQTFGVAHYWIADHERQTLEAYVLRSTGYEQVGKAGAKEIAAFAPFANLQIPVHQLWRPT